MTSLLFFNVSCSLPPPGLCTGCSLPPSTPTSPEVIPPSRLTPHRPMRPGSRSYPPHTVHACRALSTTGVDLGSDLVAQTRLWGCHSTGQACSFRSGLGPSARHREDTPHVCQRKNQVQGRTTGHSEGTLETRSSQEGLLQIPSHPAWSRPGSPRHKGSP